MTSPGYDAAVVGAGVFGSWIALKLLRAGGKVLLLDAFGAGNSRSSSGDESRIIRAGYGADEIYSRMAIDSLREWRDLFARRNCSHLFQPTGVLWMGMKDDRYMADSARVLKSLGAPVEEFSSAELQERYPQFDGEGIEHGLFEPQSGALLGRRAVQAVCHAYLEEGGEFLTARIAPPEIAAPEVDSPRKSESPIRLENGERIRARQFVFACGPWLGKIFPDVLGDRLFVTRQEVFYFAAPSGREYGMERLPVWLHMNDQVYGFPDLENRGVKLAFDEHGPRFDPDTEDRLVSRESLAKMRSYLARRLPALARSPVAETRVCQYENTSNGDFFLDRHPAAENIWLAGGGSGHGFKHGPALAEYLQTQIAGTGKAEPRFALGAKATRQNRTVF